MNTVIPNDQKLVEATFQALKKLGGIGDNGEICKTVLEILNLSEEILKIPVSEKNPASKFEARLGWTRTALRLYGAIENRAISVWAITSDYSDVEEVSGAEVFAKLNEENKLKKELKKKESLTQNKDTLWNPSIEEYNPNISVEKWVELLNDSQVFSETALRIIACMKDFGGAATCKQLAIKYGETEGYYNIGSTQLAKRVHKATNCPLTPRNQENWKWWPILYVGRDANADEPGTWVWKLRDELDEALDLVQLSLANLGSDAAVVTAQSKVYTKQDFLSQVYMTEERYNTLVSLLDHKMNIILQGAPGVGKTYAAKRLAYSIMGEVAEDRIAFIQFHQNYSYEDFIMGYRPYENGFKLTNGVFYDFCMKAANHLDQTFFFIIDEINRGNMSKIFGELLMLIEKDYRKESAVLAYSGQKFRVPENVYIIGMMNTADRSLAMIDYALRRRFSFFEMEPGFDTEGFRKYQEAFNDDQFNKLIETVVALNEIIEKDDSLGPGFRIGHSYFCNWKECTRQQMQEVVNYDIIPTLEEYWFDDKTKFDEWSAKLREVVK